MGGKKRKLGHKNQQQTSRHAKRHHPPPPAAKPTNSKNPAAHRQKQQEQPTIPFGPDDRILLLGEGDLSFAASLVTHHACTNIVATVLEKSEEELTTKYPHAAANIEAITSSAGADGVRNKVVYGIDASKPFPASVARPPPNRVIFNFPHVGGKSTDVNRQVRYNQSLLVSVFTHALAVLPPGGTVVFTLFEGDPYTLWNPRDLGRHAGFQVDRSFRFQADAYPGYHHARTLGVVRSKTGEDGGGWKGEDRAARSFIFVRKGDVAIPVKGKGTKRTRDDRDDDNSDDSDDSDDR